jgi:ribonuclease HI
MPEHPLLTIHTDGASRGNPGAAAFAYVIRGEQVPLIEEAGCLGTMTNNQAEYTALVRALEHAVRLGPRFRLHIHSDSELMVKQMKGEYKVKNPDLIDLYQQAKELARAFEGGVQYTHVRRERNKRADELCNEALDGRR